MAAILVLSIMIVFGVLRWIKCVNVATEIEYLKAHQEQLRLEFEKNNCKSDESSLKIKMQELEKQEGILQSNNKNISKNRKEYFSKENSFFALDKERSSLQEAFQSLRHQHELACEKQSKELEVQGARLASKKESLIDRHKTLALQQQKIEKTLAELVRQKDECEKALKQKKNLMKNLWGHELFLINVKNFIIG